MPIGVPEKNAASLDDAHGFAGRPRLLLVEDYKPNILIATTFIEAFGYDCDVAINGQDAVDRVIRDDYFAVLMDVEMPGMNGLEATKAIRDYERSMKRPRAHIIGMTAHIFEEDRKKCLEAGMDDYVPKPFNEKLLREKLRSLAQKTIAPPPGEAASRGVYSPEPA